MRKQASGRGPKKQDRRRRIGKGERVPRRSKSVEALASAKSDGHLYSQISRVLREEILSGIYPVGTQLPKEEILRKRFSVSRFTIREAIRRLRDDGLVHSRQGAGTVVVPSYPTGSYVHHVTAINDLVAFVISSRFVIESVKMAPISREVATRIGVPSGDEWLIVRGFRYAKDSNVALCRTEYYIDRKFAAVGRLLPRHTGPFFPLIEDLFALTVTEVHQEISATRVSPGFADVFKIKTGSPALELLRVYKSSDGKLIQATLSTHPGSNFRSVMTMRRVKSEP
jgi:DNA-binding GntR family transcriptional regulator